MVIIKNLNSLAFNHHKVLACAGFDGKTICILAPVRGSFRKGPGTKLREGLGLDRLWLNIWDSRVTQDISKVKQEEKEYVLQSRNCREILHKDKLMKLVLSGVHESRTFLKKIVLLKCNTLIYWKLFIMSNYFPVLQIIRK